MQGEVVKELFGAEGAPSFVASYDELIENRRVQPDQTPDMKEVEERLRSLGYL